MKTQKCEIQLSEDQQRQIAAYLRAYDDGSQVIEQASGSWDQVSAKIADAMRQAYREFEALYAASPTPVSSRMLCTALAAHESKKPQPEPVAPTRLSITMSLERLMK